jgi:small GTP-binding protein
MHNGKTYRLQLWDTAGQERFKALIPSYLKDSNCALIVYDVNDPKSLESCQRWLEFYNEHKEDSAFGVLVGNKNDLAGYK